ncbi:MAG: glycosyltransferase [Candidatus Asgardarchaeia archaeon]
MRIGFVVTHPPKESMGSIVRVREFARYLSEFGHEVHILSPFVFRENWGSNVYFHTFKMVSGEGLSNKLYSILRKILNTPFLSRNILLRKKVIDRMIQSLADGIKNYLNKEQLDLDLIQGEQEPAAAALTRIRERLAIPVIADIHNIWPEELVVTNVIKRDSAQFKNLMNLEKEIIENADLVISVSKFMHDYFVDTFNADRNKIEIVEPGGTPRKDKPEERDKPPKAIYAGLVAYREHVDLFVKSMPYVLEKVSTSEFYITNKGEYLGKIKELAKKLGVNPHFFWVDGEDEFFEFLSHFYVGVVPSTDDIPRKIGTPVKLFDYLSVGIPVVANDIGAWSKIIEEENVGLLTRDDSKDFADAVIYFLENKDESYRIGQRGINVIKDKYNWRVSTKKLQSIHERLVSRV